MGRRCGRWIRALAAALPLSCAGGCTTWSLIESDPPGAAIRVDGEGMGTTPATVPLRYRAAWKTHRLELSLAGYRTLETTLEKRTQWGYLVADVLFVTTAPAAIVNARGPRTACRFELQRE